MGGVVFPTPPPAREGEPSGVRMASNRAVILGSAVSQRAGSPPPMVIFGGLAIRKRDNRDVNLQFGF